MCHFYHNGGNHNSIDSSYLRILVPNSEELLHFKLYFNCHLIFSFLKSRKIEYKSVVIYQFIVVVQSWSHVWVWLFVALWTAAGKASLSLSPSLLKFTLMMGFPGGSDGKESACDATDPGSVPGWGRCPREKKKNGNKLQYSCLENSMERGA